MSFGKTDSPDDLNILIASDIHLGYEEKDPIRGEDSFNTFEEVLKIAVSRDVDFILLGGDLFHDAKPSQKCLHQAFSLFRKYCMGDRPVAVEFLSDQAENFKHCNNPVVNYEDPNLNISLPVFSIHGNHDDPTGLGRTSSLDLFSESGLINYFGKWTDLKQIAISPLLLRKGATKLALYGLSYIKDERLSRLFRDRKVQLYQPKEATDEWFNIFVLHQNRADRGPNNSLPEDALPKFLDLVMWGHEHECRIEPEYNAIQGFSVIQPGSTVATSLCEGETKEKHVGVLKICKKHYDLERIPLQTVRPFIMDTVVLSKSHFTKHISDKVSDAVQNFLQEYVTNMIDKTKYMITGHKKQPTLPLVRLRVEYSDDIQTFNPLLFGIQFNKDVANPRDIVLLKKERKKRDPSDPVDLDKGVLNEILERSKGLKSVEWAVEKYFSEIDPEKGLQVLSVKGLNESVLHFIEKSDAEAISDIINHQVKKTIAFLKANVSEVDAIDESMQDYRASRLPANDKDSKNEAQEILNSKSRSKSSSNGNDVSHEISDSDDDKDNSVQLAPPTTRGRGRGRGRGSRGKQLDASSSSRTNGTAQGTRGRQPQLNVTRTTKATSSKNTPRRGRMDFSDSD